MHAANCINSAAVQAAAALRRTVAAVTAVACLFVTTDGSAVEWPEATRIAVTLSFDLDAETLWWDDRERMTGQPGPLSHGTYGPLVALPKILDLLEKHDVKATFFIPSWVADNYPEGVRRIASAGHEIGAHGVRHVAPNLLEPGEERRRLEESVRVLGGLTGARPTGYRAPAWALSDTTLALVAGEGFLYSSNLMDADVPYVHEDPAGLVELPVSWVLDDAPHFWFGEESWNKTIRSAGEVRALWQEEFAAAYADRGYFGLTLHPQFIGRPARLHMLDELLSWMMDFDGVWIATCREVAAHVSRTHATARQ